MELIIPIITLMLGVALGFKICEFDYADGYSKGYMDAIENKEEKK